MEKMGKGRWLGPQAIRSDSTLAEIEPKMEMSSFFNYFFEGILKDTLTAKNSGFITKNPSQTRIRTFSCVSALMEHISALVSIRYQKHLQ